MTWKLINKPIEFLKLAKDGCSKTKKKREQLAKEKIYYSQESVQVYSREFVSFISMLKLFVVLCPKW